MHACICIKILFQKHLWPIIVKEFAVNFLNVGYGTISVYIISNAAICLLVLPV